MLWQQQQSIKERQSRPLPRMRRALRGQGLLPRKSAQGKDDTAPHINGIARKMDASRSFAASTSWARFDRKDRSMSTSQGPQIDDTPQTSGNADARTFLVDYPRAGALEPLPPLGRHNAPVEPFTHPSAPAIGDTHRTNARAIIDPAIMSRLSHPSPWNNAATPNARTSSMDDPGLKADTPADWDAISQRLRERLNADPLDRVQRTESSTLRSPVFANGSGGTEAKHTGQTGAKHLDKRTKPANPSSNNSRASLRPTYSLRWPPSIFGRDARSATDSCFCELVRAWC